MDTMKRIWVLWVCMWCVMTFMSATNRNKQYEEYIAMYRELAISEMEKYHIPASITLAQGLLESGAGKSTLSRYFHNHFGIKCGRTWQGNKTYHNDDRPHECFREYAHPKESFEDHSLFLVKNARYASLFQLEITDYKGWAYGLKAAGYATNPRYGTLLVTLIERYELYRYDNYVSAQNQSVSQVNLQKGKKGRSSKTISIASHDTYLANGLVYIVVCPGDSWESITKELGISEKKLRKYNDLYEGYVLTEGDILYLKQKNKKGTEGNEAYILRAGESMHSVSQRYGIRLKNLYKMNRMDMSSVPEVGDVLRLR